MTMQFAQLADDLESKPSTRKPIQVGVLPGTWINSNPDSSSIARLEISESEGKLVVQGFAIGAEGLVDWGTTAASVFTDGPSSRTAAGFTCVFEFGFAETRIQGMIMKGLLVLAEFHLFKDQSGRSGYFLREYFALNHGRY